MRNNMVDLTKPPRTPGLPIYRLPRIMETKLENGLAVVLVEDRRFPMATARLGFEAGSKCDPAELAGLAESTGALLTEGTATRESRQIAEEIADIGGALHGDAGSDSLVLSGNALAENLPKLLALMTDCACNASFPGHEVELRKQNRVQELLAQRSEAGFLADEKFAEMVFSPHPYCRQDPTPESIERLDCAALAGFRDARLRPNNAVLVLLGALPAESETLAMIRDAFGAWGSSDLPAQPPAVFPAPRPRIVLIDRPGSVQADIRLGRIAIERTHADYFPLLLGGTILGGGASSRLFMNVRERLGYAYSVHASAQAMRDSGVFAVDTQVRNEVLSQAIEELYAEMRRMGSEPVTETELETTRNYLCGTFVIRLETQDGVAAQIAGTKLMGLPLEYLERYTERVRAVTPEQIRTAAAEYIAPERASVVVVGDASAIVKQLEKFGPVTVEQAK